MLEYDLVVERKMLFYIYDYYVRCVKVIVWYV